MSMGNSVQNDVVDVVGEDDIMEINVVPKAIDEEHFKRVLNDLNEDDYDPDLEEKLFMESMFDEEIDSEESDEVNETIIDAEGNMYWLPRVAEGLAPKIGDTFDTHELACQFYKKYAENAGFEVRLSNKKYNDDASIVTNRYFLCNKEGQPKSKCSDTMEVVGGLPKKRKINFKRCGCKAEMEVKYVPETKQYMVYKLIEAHNHILLSPEEMLLTRSKRYMTFSEQKNIFDACTSKVGVAKLHRMRKAMNGGFNVPGGTIRDYHNYRRDMSSFVGIKDAQMFINTLASRNKVCKDYFFEYRCNNNELEAVFWADETARLNYKEFGDAISFDATFRTNKHAMVFVPFVAVDNHKRTVVVGAALMRSEKTPDYKWLLKAFLKAHGRQPKFVITDQCAAMKQAIPLVFPESKHRLCLWHITEKVKAKVGVHISQNTNFIPEWNSLVWNVKMDPDVFEEKWCGLVERYGISNDKWFRYMYKIRSHWIPAYYKEFPMSGLMKTTSRSESINAFFNVYAAFHNDLVVFLHTFDKAIESQRSDHCVAELKTKTTAPRTISPSKMELHAASIYTRIIFFEVQKELTKAVWTCAWQGRVVEENGKRIYQMCQKSKKYDTKTIHTVVQDVADGTIECSCNFFVRNGYLCRHAFKVLLNDEAECIPEKYISRRWKRDIIPVQWLPAKVRYGEVDAEQEVMFSQVNGLVESILDVVRKDKESFTSFVEKMKQLKSELVIDVPSQSGRKTRIENMHAFLAVSEPDNVEILPPTGVRNKGCGTGKRLKSNREKAIAEAKKGKRRCKRCKKFARHDSRNCPESVK